MLMIDILTLPFDPHVGVFETEALKMHLAGRALVRAVPHFFESEGRAYWSVYLETRVHQGSARARSVGAQAETAEAQPSREQERLDVRGELSKLNEEQRACYERVRAWRLEQAKAEGLPAYVLLTNRNVLELARQRPQTLSGLREVHGIGAKRVKRHGRMILEAMHGTVAPSGTGAPEDVRGVDGDDAVGDGADGALPQAAALQPHAPDRGADAGGA